MKPSSTFLLCVLLFAFLSACAPAYDEGPLRATIVTATVPPAPTLTAPPLPTATRVPTVTPTPTRTPTEAESRAARLPALGALTWRADGDKIVLGDGVATLDQKTGGLRWDSQKHFAVLDPYLSKPENHAKLLDWMKQLKAQGIHFITFPDSKGRKEIPPYILVPTADGKDVKMISAQKGTADFVYDAKAEKILGVFPDGSGYFYLNPDGSFDLAPLQNQAEAIAAKLRKDGVIQHPDPANADIIQKATAEAILINPYGATPKEINDFIKTRTGKDFAQHFNETWGKKVGVTYEEVMSATLAQSPKDVFGHVSSIYGPSNNSLSSWTTQGVSSGIIKIAEGDLASSAYYPLEIILVKEARGSAAYLNAYRQAKNRQPFYENKNEIGSRIGAALSFAIEAFALNLHPEISPHSEDIISGLIDSAFRGGPPGWIPGQPF